ncbi:MAG: TfoX/Sxy family protein [Thalassovita sp.]
MSSPVSTIRNIGPASEHLFTKAGIHSAEELRELGADAAYAKLISSGMRPHFIGYYALVMGLQGRPWNDCQGEEKAALRVTFDAIKQAASKTATVPTGIDAILDKIGVIERQR